jgi:NAD-dependent SIR2 family protein deacetylase
MMAMASEIESLGTVSFLVGAGISANSRAPMFNEFRKCFLEVLIGPTCAPKRSLFDNMIWIESPSRADPKESWSR